MDSIPNSNHAKGAPESLTNHVLETGANLLQSHAPPNRLCAHLHAFHVYADAPHRISAAHHYCAHVNDEVRQCLLYDSDRPNARLIGVEYMISPRLYATLERDERRLWHSHVFEVKSGMLVMPSPAQAMGPALVRGAWEAAEDKEMEAVVELYGKVFQLWQVDRGDELPLGHPVLMGSFTAKEQFDFEKVVGDRDREMGVNSADKAKRRTYIAEPEVHTDADWMWKKE